MADTEKILLQISLDVDQTKQSLIDTKNSIDQFKAKLKEQNAELALAAQLGQQNSVAYRNLQLSIVDTTSTISALTKEQNSYQLALTKSQQSELQEIGSIDQMKAQLSALTAIYNTRSDAEKKADASTIQIAKDIKALSDELKNQEGALGNHTRNVGDYENAIKSATSSITIFGVNLGDVQNKLELLQGVITAQTAATAENTAALQASATVASEQAAAQTAAAEAQAAAAATAKAAAITAEELAAAEAQATAASLAQAEAAKAVAVAQELQTAATASTSGALEVFRIALISTGIGALIVALGVLIASLSQNQKVVDFVSNSVKALGAAFHVLVDAAISVEKAVVDAFSHPVDSLKTFMDFIETNVINRFKAIPVILQAVGEGFNDLIHLNFDGLKQSLKDIASGFIEFSTGLDASQQAKVAGAITNVTSSMKDAASAAFDLGAATNKLKDDENAYIVQKQVNQKKIDDLRLAARDTTDLAQRATDLKAALAIEQTQIDAEVGFAKRRADISQQEFDLRKDHSRDEETANQQAQADAIRIEDEGAQAKIKLTRELNQSLLKDDKQNSVDALAIAEELAKAREALIKNQRAKAEQEVEDAYQISLVKIKQNDTNATALRAAAVETRRIALQAVDQKYDALEVKQQQDHDKEMISLQKETTDAINQAKLAGTYNPETIYTIELAALNKNLKDQVSAIDIAKTDKLAILTQEFEEGKKNEQQYYDERDAIETAADAKKLASFEVTARAIKDKTDSFNQQQLQDNADYLQLLAANQTQYSQAALDAKLAAEDAAYNKQKTALTKQYTQEGVITAQGQKALEALDKEHSQQQILIAAETEQAKLAAISNGLGQTASLFNKGSAAFKEISIAQAIVNTYAAATAALAPPPLGAGPLFGPILAGIAIVTGLENVAKITSTDTTSSFYEGGYTGPGNPRAESARLGKKPYIYHNEEYVVSSRVLKTPQGAALVSTLEQMRTNSPASMAGISGFAEGGSTPNYVYVAQQASGSAFDQSALENAIMKGIQALPNPIVTVEDINIGQTRVASVADMANV